MKWISVENRLPEEDVGVLFYDGRYVEAGYYASGEFIDHTRCNALEATHWMPLPDPPIAEESDKV